MNGTIARIRYYGFAKMSQDDSLLREKNWYR